MNEDEAYISYGKGVLTINCIFNSEIVLKGNMFKCLIDRLLMGLHLSGTSSAFKQRFYDNASINSYTNKSAGVDINDPDCSITNFVINSR